MTTTPEMTAKFERTMTADRSSLRWERTRNVRVIELEGRQNLVDLVHRGRVRLHGEDGAIVDLWEPNHVRGDMYRVRLAVSFSPGMRERYNIVEKPLPEEPTCVLQDFEDVEVGSRLYGNKSFSVDGWDLYNAEGERIRHHNRTFVLRDLSRIELLTDGVPAYRQLSSRF